MSGRYGRRTSRTQRRQPEFLGQIAPLRIGRLDQLDLPLALPILVSRLARDRGVHRPGEFEPDERFDAIAFGEAVEAAVAVLDDALDQVRGDAGVERAVAGAGHDIDAGLKVGVHGVEARAAMDPGSRRTSHGPRSRVTSLYRTECFPAPRHAGLDPAFKRRHGPKGFAGTAPVTVILGYYFAVSATVIMDPIAPPNIAEAKTEIF